MSSFTDNKTNNNTADIRSPKTSTYSYFVASYTRNRRNCVTKI